MKKMLFETKIKFFTIIQLFFCIFSIETAVCASSIVEPLREETKHAGAGNTLDDLKVALAELAVVAEQPKKAKRGAAGTDHDAKLPALAKVTDISLLCQDLMEQYTHQSSRSDAKLTWCDCTDLESRIVLILKQLNTALEQITPENLIVHTEFGEEGCLQIYLLIYALIKVGFKKIYINPFGISEQLPTQLKLLELEISKIKEGAEVVICPHFATNIPRVSLLARLNNLISQSRVPRSNSFAVTDTLIGSTAPGNLAHEMRSATEDDIIRNKSLINCVSFRPVSESSCESTITVFNYKTHNPKIVPGKTASPSFLNSIERVVEAFKHREPKGRDDFAPFMFNHIAKGKSDIIMLGYRSESAHALDDFTQIVHTSRATAEPIIYELQQKQAARLISNPAELC